MNYNEPRPEPVMNASYLSGLLITLVMAAVAMLSGLDIVQWDTTQQSLINAFITALINVAIVLATMYFGARPKVTPVASPSDDEGVELVRVDGQKPVVNS